MKKAAVNDFKSINQHEFGYLKSFNLEKKLENKRNPEYTLKMVLAKIPYDNKELKVIFHDVRDLKVGNLASQYNLVINITVSDNPSEGINYRVWESEHEIFSFHCKSFEYKLA